MRKYKYHLISATMISITIIIIYMCWKRSNEGFVVSPTSQFLTQLTASPPLAQRPPVAQRNTDNDVVTYIQPYMDHYNTVMTLYNTLYKAINTTVTMNKMPESLKAIQSRVYNSVLIIQNSLVTTYRFLETNNIINKSHAIPILLDTVAKSIAIKCTEIMRNPIILTSTPI